MKDPEQTVRIHKIIIELEKQVSELNVRELLWECVQSIEKKTSPPSGAVSYNALNQLKDILING